MGDRRSPNACFGPARVNAANDLGVTPLALASENGSGPWWRRCFTAGADANSRLLTGETSS